MYRTAEAGSPVKMLPKFPCLSIKRSLLASVDERVADRGVAVRMVAHALAHRVGHLVELAVVHFVQRMQDAALHGLEPVVEVGDGPVLDDVGGVFEIIVIVEILV